MGSTETLYRVRFKLPELLEQGKLNILRCPVYAAGALVAPASGTISIFNDANVAVVNGVPVTSITGNVALYSLLAATIADMTRGEGWRVEWVLTFASPAETHTFLNDAALVRNRFYPTITEDDLYGVASSLDPSKAGVIHSETTFTGKIDEGFVQLEQWLIANGDRPNLILSPSSLRKAHLYLTLSLIFEEFATRLNAAHMETAKMYREQFRQARNEFKFLYASVSDDGTPGDGNRGRRRGGVRTLWLTSRDGTGDDNGGRR